MDKNQKHYIVNTFSKAVIEIDQQHYDCLTDAKQDLNMVESSLPELYKQGILVDDELDEMAMLRYVYGKQKNATDILELVIAPTLECNFRCVYCFETPRSGFMSDKVWDSLKNYIETEITQKPFKRIKITWYGGEPLLCLDIIENCSHDITEIAFAHGISVEYTLVTNGYLLNNKVLKRLENANIRRIQTTLDGSAQYHDKRRKLVNGRETFSTVVENIKLFKNTNFQVSIRVNIDKHSAAGYVELENCIKSLQMDNIEIYPAIVEKTENQTPEQKSLCLSCEEYGHFAIETANSYYLKQGLSNFESKCCFCPAEREFSFVVDELGNFYKCWNSIGYDSDILFNVCSPEIQNPVISSQYLGRDPFTEEECKQCAYLPICMGGCNYARITTGIHQCVVEKYVLEQILNTLVLP